MEKVDCVVIGAGVVGLAIARALAQEGREVIVLEAESAFGQHTSSRNSGDPRRYPAGSLKALHCLRGKLLLYQYCRSAASAIAPQADRGGGRQRDAAAGGAAGKGAGQRRDRPDLDDRRVLAEVEPRCRRTRRCIRPAPIVDSHALMLSLLADAGAVLALQSRVTGGQRPRTACA
jgi:glycine/D-amino acid oxidase-like deaminating enzyme